ncbi:MAG: hypothetical protein ACR2N6_02555 [Miltoncostaeaceae bacterium]
MKQPITSSTAPAKTTQPAHADEAGCDVVDIQAPFLRVRDSSPARNQLLPPGALVLLDVVLGTNDDELISFHGGMGGPQSHPFILAPRGSCSPWS